MKLLSLLALVLFTASVGAGDRNEPPPTLKLTRHGHAPMTFVF